MAERYGLTETEWNERLDGIQHTAERAHAEIALHAGLLAAHDGRLTELENAHAVRGVNTRQELDTHAERLEGLKVLLKSAHATTEAAAQNIEALTASVGLLRADVTALQAQEPVRVLLARLETLSDERNAARRSQMEVAAERDAARRSQMEVAAERDAARTEAQRADDRFSDEWQRAETLRKRLVQAESERHDARAKLLTEREDLLKFKADAQRAQVAAQRRIAHTENELRNALTAKHEIARELEDTRRTVARQAEEITALRAELDTLTGRGTR